MSKHWVGIIVVALVLFGSMFATDPDTGLKLAAGFAFGFFTCDLAGILLREN